MITDDLLNARELVVKRLGELIAAMNYGDHLSATAGLLDGIPGDDAVEPCRQLSSRMVRLAAAMARTTHAMQEVSGECAQIRARLGGDRSLRQPAAPRSSPRDQIPAAQEQLGMKLSEMGLMLASVIERSAPAFARMGNADAAQYLQSMEDAERSASELHRNTATMNAMLGRILGRKGGTA